jgi:predicted ATPase/Tfp pilus assembly protein PilF
VHAALHRGERTTLIGREADARALGDLLEGADRLVTLVGTAGVGKTRLALHLAAQRRAALPIIQADLRLAGSEEEAAAVVATAAGVSLAGHSDLPAVDRLGLALLAQGDLLLVLDNFEHLVGCAEATVGRWLELAPSLRCLVTSRHALGIAGEARYEVGPLAPEPALELFLARVRAVSPGFAPTPAQTGAAREIVRRLDHLPLAIELAAARSVVLSLEEIRERLDRRFELLRAQPGHRTGARHGTLREALEWSWSLLSEDERRALAALAVCQGGFSAAAAVAVIGAGEEPGLERLSSLREKSLVLATVDDGHERRFDLLESVRELAIEKLDQGPERAAVEQRHAAHFLQAGQEWAASVDGPETLRHLRADAGNLVSAGRVGLQRAPEVSTRVALAVCEALCLSGPHALALQLLDDVVAAAAAIDGGATELHARALFVRGGARLVWDRPDEGAADLELAATCARDAGAAASEAEARRRLGTVWRDTGDFERARHHLERAAELFAQIGDIRSLARTSGNLGTLYRQQGRLDAGLSHYQRALEYHRQAPDRGSEGLVIAGIGHTHAARGEAEQARTSYQQALLLLRAVGDRRTQGIVLDRLALLALEDGEAGAALPLLDEARDHLGAVGDHRHQAVVDAHRAVARAAVGWVADGESDLARASESIDRVDDARMTAALRALRAAFQRVAARRASGRSAELRAARAALSDERCLAATPGEVPFVEYLSDARRLLDRVLAGCLDERKPAAPVTDVRVIQVGPRAAWARLEGGKRIDLPPLLARVFEALVRARIDDPGQPLEPAALAALVWPDQGLDRRAAGVRLYAAIKKLRQRGLAAVIVHQAGGYLVHPAIRCDRVA